MNENRIRSYQDRIKQIQGSIKRLIEVIAHLEKDIEKSQVILSGVASNHFHLEKEIKKAEEDNLDKFKLSLMYQKLLHWHIEAADVAEDIDGMIKTLILKRIAKLNYEYELEKLIELEGSGEE